MRDQNRFPGLGLFFFFFFCPLARGRPDNALQCLLLKHPPGGFWESPLHPQPHRGEPLGLEGARFGALAQLVLPWQSQPFAPRGRRAESHRATTQFFPGAAAAAAGAGWDPARARAGRGGLGCHRQRETQEQKRDSQLQLSSQSGLLFGSSCKKTNPQSKAGLA